MKKKATSKRVVASEKKQLSTSFLATPGMGREFKRAIKGLKENGLKVKKSALIRVLLEKSLPDAVETYLDWEHEHAKEKMKRKRAK